MALLPRTVRDRGQRPRGRRRDVTQPVAGSSPGPVTRPLQPCASGGAQWMARNNTDETSQRMAMWDDPVARIPGMGGP